MRRCHDAEHVTVDHARLYDSPATPVAIVMGVSGAASVELAAQHADGIMTTAPDPEIHLAAIRKYLDAGPDQRGFTRFAEKKLLPRLR